MSGYVSLGHYLGASASRYPTRQALVDSTGQSVTYRELDERANRIANFLVANGVSPGDRVGICLPKGIDSVATIFGVLKAGAAYVPTDYTAPAERNRYIFDNCAVAAAVVDRRALAIFDAAAGAGAAPSSPRVVVVHGERTASDDRDAPGLVDAAVVDDQPSEFSCFDARPNDLAYILYTSGSTGLPKGVMLTHDNATSFVDWCSDTFRPTPDDRFTSHAPFHFDLSILDLYTPIKHGATLYVISEELGKSPVALGEFIEHNGITCWYSVPSILTLMAQYGKLDRVNASTLRVVNFAGEVFPVKHLRALRTLWPHPTFYNLYGPTETNVCTYFEIPARIPDDRTTPYPIGKPCSHCEALVLNDRLEPVAREEEGLLYIAGRSVLQGYWANQERTDEAILNRDGKRYYNTGDVVRLDANGDFEFLGRYDRMVKRHGYRIELGEIEAALYKHPDVAEAAAISFANDNGGTVVIKAVIASKSGTPLGIIALKSHCAAHLPAYMIPDTFAFSESLPLTSTGKVDYQSLLRTYAAA